ncbi:MAG: efflux RND transporter permease subunit [Pseudomonadota bacterium]
MIRRTLDNPRGVFAATLLVLGIGLWSVFQMSVQLLPNVEANQITIITRWAGAGPQEVEESLLKPQEEVLRGLPRLVELEAQALPGIALIRLQFAIGVDPQAALIDIANRLARVTSYPPDVIEPQIVAGPTANEAAISWLSIKPKPGNNTTVTAYTGLVERRIRPIVERIEGVAGTNLVGGQQRQVQVLADPWAMARNQLTLSELRGYLVQNRNVSGGYFGVGRRQYALRLNTRLSPEEMEDAIIRNDERGATFLKEVADIRFGLADEIGVFSENGGQSIAISVQPNEGANVIRLMSSLRETVAQLEQSVLEPAGLEIQIVYDESIYVKQAITLVVGNLIMGIILAVAVLWFFIRHLRTTLVIAVCIPLTLMTTFILLNGFGRTLNVISLAGLAFAVGLSLDAGIVVLENIHRHVSRSSDSILQAIAEATVEVRGALIASSVTTVAVFAPIIFLKDVSAQLFADLAITISSAVGVSVLVAFFLVPTLARVFGVKSDSIDPFADFWASAAARITKIGDSPLRRISVIIGCVIVSIGGTVFLLPQADYLPDGRQNQLYAYIVPPPGLSMDTARTEITDVIDSRLTPYLEEDHPLGIENYWLGFFGRVGFLGATARDPKKLDAIIDVVNSDILQGFPDTFGRGSRTSIFSRFGGGRFVDVNVKAQSFEDLLAAARRTQTALVEAFPGGSVRALPGLAVSEPELRLRPDWRNLAASNLSRADLAAIVRAYGDGLWIGEYFDGAEQIDIVVRVAGWSSPEQLMSLPVHTGDSGTVPLDYLTVYERSVGPGTIRRIDGERTITLRLTPPPGVAIEKVITDLEALLAENRQTLAGRGASFDLKGTAEALGDMLSQFLLVTVFAVMVLFFILTTLFASFRDAALVIFTIPLASVGGVVMLRLVNLVVFQPMDLLTIIGFIVVFGLAVNNAILLVAQYRAARGTGAGPRDAVENALRLRLRPIAMTMATTVFGLIPLLIVPGAGAELYRGLAAVILGGICANTILTVLFVPLVLRTDERNEMIVREESRRPLMEAA